ncbi:MAG: ABC transporter permease [Chloroflexi bacterium]|nr:MAG: ABC transporter permease [Chloroflexota bacterium]
MPYLFRYIFRRFFLTLIAIFGVIVLAFLLTRLLPNNPAALRAGPLADEAIIKQYEKQMGLDQPLFVQFSTYFGQLVKGDLGESWRTGQPVIEELGIRIPATLELALSAFFIALVVGLTLGILAAVYADTWIDQAARVFATLGASLALFWLALVGVYVFYYLLHWAAAPVGRLTIGLSAPPDVTGLILIDSLIDGDFKTFKDGVSHIWLPACTLAFIVSAPIIKISRAAMKDVLNADYIRTARAIGVSSWELFTKDALMNAFIPILTMLGIVFGYLMGGNLIVEQVFAWPGIGQYAWKALITNDFNAVQGFVILIAFVYVSLNFLIDVTYALVNPQIRLE